MARSFYTAAYSLVIYLNPSHKKAQFFQQHFRGRIEKSKRGAFVQKQFASEISSDSASHGLTVLRADTSMNPGKKSHITRNKQAAKNLVGRAKNQTHASV